MTDWTAAMQEYGTTMDVAHLVVANAATAGLVSQDVRQLDRDPKWVPACFLLPGLGPFLYLLSLKPDIKEEE